jgi:hypothetical protein
METLTFENILTDSEIFERIEHLKKTHPKIRDIINRNYLRYYNDNKGREILIDWPVGSKKFLLELLRVKELYPGLYQNAE